MPQEPTYSQIDAACKAYDANCIPGDFEMDRDAMRLALIAAQGVDRNIFGDYHVGGSVGSVRFMTHTVEERTAIMGWEHSHTAVVPSLRSHIEQLGKETARLSSLVGDQQAQLQENEGVMQAMDGILKKEIRARTDATYMLAAVVQMLGPIGRKVWKLWQDKGLQRVHTSWGPKAAELSGEEIAQVHLDFEAAPKTLVHSIDTDTPKTDVQELVKSLAKRQDSVEITGLMG